MGLPNIQVPNTLNNPYKPVAGAWDLLAVDHWDILADPSNYLQNYTACGVWQDSGGRIYVGFGATGAALQNSINALTGITFNQFTGTITPPSMNGAIGGNVGSFTPPQGPYGAPSKAADTYAYVLVWIVDPLGGPPQPIVVQVRSNAWQHGPYLPDTAPLYTGF